MSEGVRYASLDAVRGALALELESLRADLKQIADLRREVAEMRVELYELRCAVVRASAASAALPRRGQPKAEVSSEAAPKLDLLLLQQVSAAVGDQDEVRVPTIVEEIRPSAVGDHAFEVRVAQVLRDIGFVRYRPFAEPGSKRRQFRWRRAVRVVG